MHKITPIGATHDLAPPENWDQEADGPCGSLWVRVGLLGDRKLLTFTSAWKPSPAELAALSAGAAVEIDVVGTQPPMRVDVVGEYATMTRDTVTLNASKTVTLNDEATGLGYDEHGPATP